MPTDHAALFDVPVLESPAMPLRTGDPVRRGDLRAICTDLNIVGLKIVEAPTIHLHRISIILAPILVPKRLIVVEAIIVLPWLRVDKNLRIMRGPVCI